MAWTTPTTVAAGEVLTAARYNQDTVSNAFMGRAVYTNEAARDAAIPSPEEGMICYLTAPTVPAANGDTDTAVPTGVTTIYNGSVWVCVTPVAARTDTSGTTSLTSFTTTLSGGGTNPSVTLVTGTQALISFSVLQANSVASNQHFFQSFSVSGATTLAANEPNGVFEFRPDVATFSISLSKTFLIGGLTAGTNTFALEYKTGGFGTVTVVNRSICVTGVA